MSPEFLQPQLRLPYSRASWIPLLRELFPAPELFAQAVDFELTSEREREIASARRQFGRATLADGKVVAYYEIDVADNVDLLRNRVALRQLIVRCIDEVNAHAVLAFFVQPSTESYRLTYAARESTLNLETMAVETQETAARRFTYVLGPGETRRTAALRLAGLSEKSATATLSDVTDAFSVELLNKEFFQTYKQHYAAFCSHLLSSDIPTRVFGLHLAGLEDKALDRALKPVRDFVKKLLGRLVFLCFLQKKGWLGCPPLSPTEADLPQEQVPWTGGAAEFLRELFDSCPEPDSFHSQRLVPLFFEALNRPYRSGHLLSVPGANSWRIPYLNGGLFERDFAAVDQLDFPASLFDELLTFFGQYHFTIDENDPEDHEIGIDPEMLGHIFENLLEDNKDKGAYYTPKAVVQYMCQQSLIHALAGHFPGDPAARGEIERLIRTKEPIDARDQQSWLAAHATALADKLDTLRICDPAIGSGAFPIGLLQEIYWTKLALNPSLDRALAKRSIIQRSIHGVDLDAGAVEIARLRFWLALVVEENAPVPLPNLDYQIMQGNSLLESFEGIPLDHLDAPVSTFGVTVFGSDQHEFNLATPTQAELHHFTSPARANIANLRANYYACHEPEEKLRLRREIDEAVLGAIDEEIERRRRNLEETLTNWESEMERRKREAQRARKTSTFSIPAAEKKKRERWAAELASLDRKNTKLHTLLADSRAERPFFLWHLWFRHVLAELPDGRGGFDIVIANPPYGADLGIENLQAISESFEVAGKRPDSYAVFIEAGIRLLRDGGAFCMIVPTGWYSGVSFKTLRRFIATATNPRNFVNLPYDVFGAWVDTTIIVAEKRAERLIWPRTETCIATLKPFQKRFRLRSVGDFLQSVTTVNIARWFDEGEFDDYLTFASPNELEAFLKIRRFQRTLGELCDIQRGVTPFHLIDVPNHPNCREAFAGTVRRYRLDRGPTRYLRYDESLAEYKPERYFVGPRLLLRELISRQFQLQAMFVDENFVTNKSMQSILAKSDGPPLKVVLALLNSRLMSWFFLVRSNIGQRDDFPKIVLDETRHLPIPEISLVDEVTLTSLVDRILAAKHAGDEASVSALEAEIDAHVFRLYGLTPEEIELVQRPAT